ncbi:aldolase [Amniculicola lignicola CBS 123094]|uniref:deoxyribose-phosphate aldolase n=1 Tax=Amniculicola lignicola CBS 123094 TaxID=1392246 RepID=A0A6A5WPK0_9PLEO|nr:aldolase [Amniculicola lignicola CBS 123094]
MSSTTLPPSSEPTASEVLVQEYLAQNPVLDKELGDIEIMTDRYTNAEWAKQIAETVERVQGNLERGARKYECPAVASKEFAKTIDHTVLKLDAKEGQIDALCSEARTEGFKSVCVRLNYVSRCVSNLKGSDVLVACVVGFHEGTQDTYSKLREARAAVVAGAAELDVVLNHSILTSVPSTASVITSDSLTAFNTAANSKPPDGASTPVEGPYSKTNKAAPSKDLPTTSSPEAEAELPNYSAIYTELASIRSLCPNPVVLKLILETSQLTPSQILAASHLAAAANFDFIKTSTGFNGAGATLPNIQLMVAASEYLSTIYPRSNKTRRGMEVKASGGVRSLEDAVMYLEAGATRLGTSSGLWIMQEARRVGEERTGQRPGGVSRLYTDDSTDGY